MHTTAHQDAHSFKQVVKDIGTNLALFVIAMLVQVLSMVLAMLVVAARYFVWLILPIVIYTDASAVSRGRPIDVASGYGAMIAAVMAIAAAGLQTFVGMWIITVRSSRAEIRRGLADDPRARSDEEDLFFFSYLLKVTATFRAWLPWVAIPRFIQTRQLPFQVRP